ncbi:furin-like protease 2 [Oratosquilla oratoria]|uniref:furin-like protease 2 n=1 Tax=Oratosquilla oratoria TaxID=337810 RepID=UPI003F76DBFD
MARTSVLALTVFLTIMNMVYSFDERPYGVDNDKSQMYHNQFAVHIKGGTSAADVVANKHGFTNLGQIGSLDDMYLFEHQHVHKRSADPSPHHHQKLHSDPQVLWVEQQVEKRRVKRDGLSDVPPDAAAQELREKRQFHPKWARFGLLSFPATPSRGGSSRFPDPLFEQQWYLSEGANGGFDMNVGPAWRRGYTGKGVVVSILDDGIQHNHPDLAQNYDPQASTDINSNDQDPMPQDNGDNRHGTRCAGEVAGVAFNDYCGVGVAYNASIGGVRMLDGTVNDAVEARAISLNPDHVDIYSASWGPEDDGKTVDGPGPLAKRAFINGVIRGRHGKGSIFVWASGNGGRHTDNCNCDGYTNSIFTLSISSASQRGFKPWYLEECSSTLATTYSSGTPGLDRSVATVDMDGLLRPEKMCTIEHTGTSASAPMAAGIVALALEANPDLTWRDLQHIVVKSSRWDPLIHEAGWFVNGVGRRVSHKFGYGLMDAARMVDLAEKWTTVPAQHVCQTIVDVTDQAIPTAHEGTVEATITSDGCAGTSAEVRYLEHVQARVSLRFSPRGNINIKLTSPSGTTSTLLFERPRDVLSERFDDWPFLSVHFWGEKAAGTWKLTVTNSGARDVRHPGVLLKWQLILHGTREHPERLRGTGTTGNFQSQHPEHEDGSFFSPTPFRISDLFGSGSQIEATIVTPDGKVVQDPNSLTKGASNATSLSGLKEDSQNREVKNNFFDHEVCHSECLGGCSGTGPDKCKSCKHYNLEGECVSSCPDGTYSSETGECLGCHSSCVGCTGPRHDQCVSCAPQHLYVLHLGLCVLTCTQGYYAVNTTCERCGNLCASCNGSDSCTKCDHHLLLYNGSCHTVCPHGTYESQENVCEPCHPECSSCVGGTNVHCATCPEQTFMSQGRCAHQCPKGMYGEQNTRACVLCPSGCATCSSNSCSSCLEGWRLKSGSCVAMRKENCKVNEFMDKQGCHSCHPSCLSCIGPNSTDCLHCARQLKLHKSTCVGTCPSGYFALRGQCVPCPNGCSSCSSYTNCSVCENRFFLHNNRCLAACPDGMFSDRGICTPCDASCQTCFGPGSDQCASCFPESLLLGTSCRKGCPPAFYASNTECLPCYHNCKTCKGSGLRDCTSCHEYQTLDGGICLECRAGNYFNEELGGCAACHNSCLTCQSGGADGCTSCQPPLSLHPSTRMCRPCCSPSTDSFDLETDCCRCDPSTGQCYGAVTADKRRIALSLSSGSPGGHVGSSFFSMTSLLVIICMVNLVVFGAVFIILQARLTGSLCWVRDYYSYKKLPLSAQGMAERVSLTVTPFTEEEEDEDEENELLYTRT